MFIKNPYNPNTEPISHGWFDEVKRPQLEAALRDKKPQLVITIVLDQPLLNEESLDTLHSIVNKSFKHYSSFSPDRVTIKEIEK